MPARGTTTLLTIISSLTEHYGWPDSCVNLLHCAPTDLPERPDAWFKRSAKDPWLQVLGDARLAEMFVPYHSGSPRFWDISYNFSLCNVSKDDCGHFGKVLDTPPTVVHEIRDRGLMWVDSVKGSRRGQKLVLFATLNAATTGSTASPWTSNVAMPVWSGAATPDGTYTIQATATDKAGNTFTGSAITFTLDKTNPITATVTIRRPPAPPARSAGARSGRASPSPSRRDD